MRFKAYIEPERYVDLSYAPDPVKTHLPLIIENSCPFTLYFKIKVLDENWSIAGASEKQLGSISNMSWKFFIVDLQRPKPGSDVEETITLIVEAYIDSNYTVLFESQSLNVTMHLEYIENFPNVTIFDFNNGSYQGWSLSGCTSRGVTSERSFEAGGCSLFIRYASSGSCEGDMYRTVSIGGSSKARLSFYFGVKLYTEGWYSTSQCYARLRRLRVLADDEEILKIGTHATDWMVAYVGGERSITKVFGWFNVVADLSKFIGQTKTLHIKPYFYNFGPCDFEDIAYFDHVVLAWD